jgi:hypothetical protein
VVCSPDELWLAARALIERGWELEALTLFPAGRESGAEVSDWCHVLLAVTRPGDNDLIEDPYDVELRTADVATSIRVPALRLAGAPLRIPTGARWPTGWRMPFSGESAPGGCYGSACRSSRCRCRRCRRCRRAGQFPAGRRSTDAGAPGAAPGGPYSNRLVLAGRRILPAGLAG